MSKMEYMWFLLSFLTPIASSHGILSPEQFMKTVIGIKSNEDFFDNYVRQNGSRINITRLHDVQGDTDDSWVVGGEEVPMAVFDNCSPRPTTHFFGVDDPDPYVMYWPPCTRIITCGGCSTNSMMSCVPVRVSIKSVQTAKTRLPSPGSPFFEFVGMETQLLEEHIDCEPRCTVQPSDCTAMQEHSELDCMCMCLNQGIDCGPNHYYDDRHCACRCTSETVCIGSHIIFDERLCRCRVMTINELNQVLLVGGLTRQEVAEIMIGNLPEPTTTTTTTTTPATTTTTTTTPAPTTTTTPTTTPAPTTTTTPTTTTPTTTTTTRRPRITTPRNACSRVRCHVNWSPRLLTSGICHCMLNFFPAGIRVHGMSGLRYRREALRRRKGRRPRF